VSTKKAVNVNALTLRRFIMIGGLGMPELLVIMVIVMIIFGGKKLPEIGSGIGKAIQGFRKATEEPAELLKDATKMEDKDQGLHSKVG
jgi:sec-independent protein translocase protein TatA